MAGLSLFPFLEKIPYASNALLLRYKRLALHQIYMLC